MFSSVLDVVASGVTCGASNYPELLNSARQEFLLPCLFFIGGCFGLSLVGLIWFLWRVILNVAKYDKLRSTSPTLQKRDKKNTAPGTGRCNIKKVKLFFVKIKLLIIEVIIVERLIVKITLPVGKVAGKHTRIVIAMHKRVSLNSCHTVLLAVESLPERVF